MTPGRSSAPVDARAPDGAIVMGAHPSTTPLTSVTTRRWAPGANVEGRTTWKVPSAPITCSPREVGVENTNAPTRVPGATPVTVTVSGPPATCRPETVTPVPVAGVRADSAGAGMDVVVDGE